MNFKKLKQLSNDIDLLEQSGKYSAAEVLHKKFIKEAQAQAQNSPNVVNVNNQSSDNRPSERKDFSDGSYVLKKRNPDYSEDHIFVDSNGFSKIYKNVPPEKVIVNYQTSPGNWTTGLVNKGQDPRMVDPAFAASQRSKAWENKIPGYVDFLRFKPMPYQEREFREIGGLNSDAGKILYNELAVKTGQKPIEFPGYETQLGPGDSPQAPTTQTQPSNVSATPVNQTPATQTPTTQTDVGKTPTIDPNYQGYQTPTTTNAPVQQTPSQPGTQPQSSSIPKLQERIDHYNKKIQEYKSVTDPKRKSEMFKYLNQYIKANYDQGLLDPQSYRNLMTDLG
jgi:hypothetical protein